MRWRDGQLPDDARLRDALEASLGFRPDLEVHTVLRHVPGRRVTALAHPHDRPSEPIVVKVFHGPRARGNHRRLTQLAEAGLADLVPATHGHDESGRIGVVGYRHGIVLDQVADDEFVTACAQAGSALRRLHSCGAELDREWTMEDELRQLVDRAPASTSDVVRHLVAAHRTYRPASMVPAHRDCHPRQLVVHDHRVSWIDLDDTAMAPPGLDLGNLLAHLTREAHLGRRTADVVGAARRGCFDAYGWDGPADEPAMWERLALARLAGLAEQRHGRPDERDALLRELAAA